MWRPIDEDYE
jgi:hypothetical protein